MSGVEVALAIVPICLSALNGISILRAKFHILQHHHGEVERVRKRFKAQVGIFQDELLRVFVDSCEARGAVGRGRAEFMILGDDAWNALEWKEKEAELQKCVEEYLGERFSRFCGCIKEVETITREMYEKLRVFADPNKRVSPPLLGRPSPACLPVADAFFFLCRPSGARRRETPSASLSESKGTTRRSTSSRS